MANIKVKDHDAAAKYLSATGAGTDLDPHITAHECLQGTHDDLLCNATIQVGDADVANGNPVPVSDAGGSLTVDGSVTVADGGGSISVDDGAGSLTVDNAALAVVGGGAEATALRVTMANDSTGVLSVDDNGGSLTVDGAVSVDDGAGSLTVDDGGGALSVDDNGSTLSVDDGDGSITVDQAYHDNLQCNANLQVGDADVGVGNPVPVSDAGGALTVDGTVTVQDGGGAISVDDNGGSLTVDGTVAVQQAPTTSGGYSIYRDIDLDETGINIKGSAGQIFGWFMHNAATSTRYVKFYNTAGAPTVGVDTPILTLPMPAGASANVEYLGGIACSTGIGIGATTGVGDGDSGAPGANEVIVNVFYK